MSERRGTNYLLVRPRLTNPRHHLHHRTSNLIVLGELLPQGCVGLRKEARPPQTQVPGLSPVPSIPSARHAGCKDGTRRRSCPLSTLLARKHSGDRKPCTVTISFPTRTARHLLGGAEDTDPTLSLPYKLMYRMQLSTTSGIACPESLRRKTNVSFIGLGSHHRRMTLQTQIIASSQNISIIGLVEQARSC